MKVPLQVEIIAYAPTAYYHCTHCEVAWREMGMSNQFHQEQVGSSLPPDLAQEYAEISEWVRQIFRKHCDQVMIKLIDAASLEGVYKSLRYGVRRYPTVIIDRDARFSGGTWREASQEITRRLGLPVSA